ncbi:MAG: dienelactone hydrolase family protein [Thiotrichaceae bacterium]|nr:dienelactone hydrolase family protein [Thiotrichaceae bacterium]
MNYLPCVEVETQENPDASILWMHGLGADGNDFVPLIPELRLPKELAVRFIFPSAPSIPVTINNHYVMPAWYDILEMSIDRKVDTIQLMKSATAIAALIDREIERGIASERIILAGFSQGGAVAYECALSYPKKLAGIMALSTYFATEETIKKEGIQQDIPIFIAHGKQDPVVPFVLAESAFSKLSMMGYKPEIKSYTMEHSLCGEEIRDISAWLQQCL